MCVSRCRGQLLSPWLYCISFPMSHTVCALVTIYSNDGIWHITNCIVLQPGQLTGMRIAYGTLQLAWYYQGQEFSIFEKWPILFSLLLSVKRRLPVFLVTNQFFSCKKKISLWCYLWKKWYFQCYFFFIKAHSMFSMFYIGQLKVWYPVLLITACPANKLTTNINIYLTFGFW